MEQVFFHDTDSVISPVDISALIFIPSAMTHARFSRPKEAAATASPAILRLSFDVDSHYSADIATNAFYITSLGCN
jgi:hypothetical protein